MNKWIIPVMIAIVALLMPMSSSTVSAQDGAGLSISKSAAPTLAAVGDNITYTYTITNTTDNLTISGISLQDDMLGAIDLGGVTSLDADGTVTATAIYTVVEADLPGPLVNTATASGTDAEGNPFTASATATVQLSYTASLQLAKVANPTSAGVGDNVTYSYTITNNGPVAVTNISLTDDPLGAISLGGQTSLNPGSTITATAVYTIAESDLPGPLANTATVSGKDPNGNTVTASAMATVQLNYVASLQLAKVASPTSAAVGDNITYTYTITNNGPVIIDSIALTDDPLGTIDLGGVTSLNARGTTTAIATYTVVEADLPGPLVNTATVSGRDPDGNVLTASATATVELTGAPSLQVTKSADRSSASPHQTINYTYTVTNNGNVTINKLSVQDDKLGALSLASPTLAPGKSLTATASHMVTIADLPGPITNTATASGTDSTGKSISVTSDQVSVSLYTNVWELFKSEILKLMGVPGKGIEKAPGLQKPFNPRSKAAEHHGVNTDNITQSDNETPKLNGEGKGTNTAPGLHKHSNPNSQAAEQLQIREEEENQGTEEQLQITEEVQNQAGNGHGNQGNGEVNPGKGQLKKNNGSTDNQTGTQGASDNGHKHDKGKTNNGSKSGK